MVNWWGLVAFVGAVVLLAWWGHSSQMRARCVHWDWDGNLKPCPYHYDDGSAKPPIDDW